MYVCMYVGESHALHAVPTQFACVSDSWRILLSVPPTPRGGTLDPCLGIGVPLGV